MVEGGSDTSPLEDYVRERNIRKMLAAHMAAVDVDEFLREDKREKDAVSLSMKGPSLLDKEKANAQYGSDLSVLCFLSVDGSDEVWAALHHISGKHHRPFLVFSRIDEETGKLDPITEKRMGEGEENAVQFKTPTGDLLRINLSTDPNGIIRFKTDGKTDFHVWANPNARVDDAKSPSLK